MRDNNSDRYGTDIINMLLLNGPQDLPIFALELMHEEGYDVRTFKKNGDELINVSYIAVMKAEKEANTPTVGDMLKEFGMGAAGLANFAADLTPVIGNLKGAAEGIAGKDLLGNELTDLERGLGFLGGYGDAFKHGSRIVNRIIKFFTNGVRVSDDARFILAIAQAGRYDDVLPTVNRADTPNAPRQGNSSIDQHSVNVDGVKSSGAVEGAGKIVGSLDGLSSAEKTVINDLVSQGKIVEIIPKTTTSKTPDFLVNGVKTELKTLENPNINTGITRIQKGFKQGAETVIIDGRSAGLSSEQAQQIIDRVTGTYSDKTLPGRVEIWTNNGTITFP